MREVLSITVDESEAGVRLDRWFRRRWPHLTQGQLHKLIRTGQVRVDGKRAKPDARLEAGAVVRAPPIPDALSAREREGLDHRDVAYARSLTLYEDDEVLALNKPSGLAVQGGTKTARHVDRLLSAWGEGLERPRLVHRLDRDTSGVLVLGKTPQAAAHLAASFAGRKAQKTYWAVVMGTPEPADGDIELALVKRGVGDREVVMPADPSDPLGEPADTEFVTLARAGSEAAWMALRPHTGRTHQLRAHMLALGHPILGDPKYGTQLSGGVSQGLKLQLHARRLTLPHPSGRSLMLEAPLSPQMQAGFARFGFDEAAADPEPFARRRS
jgi:23S rRNA pseudouridine955/2504/2580 synthase